jgi:hypothetical protein
VNHLAAGAAGRRKNFKADLVSIPSLHQFTADEIFLYVTLQPPCSRQLIQGRVKLNQKL